MRVEEEKINKFRSDIAHVINSLESVDMEMDWMFKRQDAWDNGIQLQIQDATRMLGMALATLVNWYDDEEE